MNERPSLFEFRRIGVWAVISPADPETGGWINHGFFTSRKRALKYASSFAQGDIYVSKYVLNEFPDFPSAKAGVHRGGLAKRVERSDLLAVGLDFTFDHV